MPENLLSIIIPIYNEENIAADYLPRIFNLPIKKEVIIVNDGSTDNSFMILENLKKKYSFELINQVTNQGKGAAVKCGLKKITGDYFIVCDADAEYKPEDIIHLFQRATSAASQEKTVIYGSRFLKNKKITFHYFINYFLTTLTNFLFQSHLTDMETCFKLIPSEALSKIKLSGRRFEIEPEITAQLLKNGYQINEQPISYNRRGYQDGKKIKARDGFLAVKTLFKEKFKK